MRNTHGGVAAELHSEGATLCHAVRLVRRDGIRLTLTDHDRALTFLGEVYRPSAGFKWQSLGAARGPVGDEAVWTGAVDDDALSEADLLAGHWNGASVDVWRLNWKSPSAYLHVLRGTLTEATWDEGRFSVGVRSMRDCLRDAVGRVYARTCDAVFGDARCGVNATISPMQVNATITAIQSDTVCTVSVSTACAAGWFQGGAARFANENAVEILNHTVISGLHHIELVSPMQGWAPGSALILRAGCDKRFSTCRDKFHNSINFQGFPHLIGPDAVIAGVDPTAPLDGGSRWRR